MDLLLLHCAFAYVAPLLVLLARALQPLLAPLPAAAVAIGASGAVHGLITLAMDAAARPALLPLWGIPHLILLPILLRTAMKTAPR